MAARSTTSPKAAPLLDGDAAASGSNVAEFSVSEIAGKLKKMVETTFDHVRVRGEVGRVSRPGSGHIYLDLKDQSAVLNGVIWKGVAGRLRIQPEQGLEVVATGRLTTFPGQSKYQIVIEALEPAGVGALMALLEERKKKFAAEGLFDDDRKRAVPFLPKCVGIVTSPSGAVIRDMLHGFAERFPMHVVVWPVRVQGETSAPEVARAVAGFNAMPATGGPVPRPDIVIVARGGGSVEDLWGFNEEAVVRAVAASDIPVISAVGHETDWTLVDLVADARAPTPTKAAEWAVPKRAELIERLTDTGGRLHLAPTRMLDRLRADLRAAVRGLPRAEDLTAQARQKLDFAGQTLGRALQANTAGHANRFARVAGRLQPGLLTGRLSEARSRLSATDAALRHGLARATQSHRMRFERTAGRLRGDAVVQQVGLGRERLAGLESRMLRAFATRIETRRQRLDAADKLLMSLSYQGVLARGYALVRGANGQPYRGAAQIGRGADLQIEFHDGHIAATVTGGAAKPPRTRKAPAKRAGGAGPDDGQGSLL